MTAQSSIPLKWYVPFANGDSSRVELPVTTSDPTRASQTLGFPPLTMQPPESGGVPPQGEDFNGGMNQVARICWWVLNGGGWPYDSTFATNSNINGYPNGAVLQSADFKGNWISTADNNQNNPDTVGTGWVPGFQYGTTAVTGLTGGTTTLTPAQAAKGTITLAGTLGSAQTIILPTWTKNWTITNSTTGAFVTIVKTAAGSGITIPQNGSPTPVAGDGTNITQSPQNIAAATQGTHPAQLGQVGDGQCRLTWTSATVVTLLPENGNNLVIGGVPMTVPSAGVTLSNSGLSASTLYWIYAGASGGTITLTASTTGFTQQSDGRYTQTGNAALRLVGAVYTNASSQFVTNGQSPTVVSFFNRRSLPISLGAVNGSTTNTSPTAMAGTVTVISFGLDATQCMYVANGYSSVATGTWATTLLVDGATGSASQGLSTSPSVAQIFNNMSMLSVTLAAGVHTINGAINVNTGGGTATVTGSLLGTTLG